MMKTTTIKYLAIIAFLLANILGCRIFKGSFNNCCSERLKKSWLRSVDTLTIDIDSLCRGYYFHYRPLTKEGIFKEARFIPVLRFLFSTFCENNVRDHDHGNATIKIEAAAFVGREKGRKMILYMYIVISHNIVVCEKFIIDRTAAYDNWSFCKYDTIPYVDIFRKSNGLFGKYRSISYEYFIKMWHNFKNENN